jgi:hypothetical protein
MPTPQQQLAQLLQPATADQIYAVILAALQKAGLPTSDWQTGAGEKTLVQAFATSLQNFAAVLLPKIAAGGLIDLAQGAWLTLLAQEMYNLQRNPATNTIRTMLLSCAAGSGPYTIAAGDLWAVGPGGNKYNNITGGIVQQPGFSGVTHTGPGTGTVTPGGTPNGGVAVKITITTSGGPGVGFFTWQASGTGQWAGGATGVPSAPIQIPGGGIYTDTASGISVTFAGAFTAGDTYSFNSFGTTALSWQSEFTNNSLANPPLNYNDAPGTITTLLTPKPGLTVSNPAPAFSGVTQIGSGTGVVTPSGTPTGGAHSVTVRIDVGGQSGVASWSYSVDGAPYVSAGQVSSASIGYGITVTLSNGSVNPSFVAGDTYSFVNPGSDITQQGVDAEADSNLQARAKARWPALASVVQTSPTLSVYDLLARSPIPPATTSQVTQTAIVTDPIINNKVLVYIAGQGSILPASVLAAVQNYLNMHVPGTDLPLVLSPVPVTITLSGVFVTVAAAALTSAQASIQAALATYFANIGLNANQSDLPGYIELSKIITIIRNTFGVKGLNEDQGLGALQINGVAGDLQLPTVAGTVQLAQWSQQVATAFTWITR